MSVLLDVPLWRDTGACISACISACIGACNSADTSVTPALHQCTIGVWGVIPASYQRLTGVLLSAITKTEAGATLVATGAGIGTSRWRLRAPRKTAGKEVVGDEFDFSEVRKNDRLLTQSTELDP